MMSSYASSITNYITPLLKSASSVSSTSASSSRGGGGSDDDTDLLFAHDLERYHHMHVRPLLDAADQLRGILQGETVTVPSIVVVGDQSSGKSSVVEALSGVGLPRGQNITTRVPLVIRLVNSESTCPSPVGAAGPAPATNNTMRSSITSALVSAVGTVGTLVQSASSASPTSTGAASEATSAHAGTAAIHNNTAGGPHVHANGAAVSGAAGPTAVATTNNDAASASATSAPPTAWATISTSPPGTPGATIHRIEHVHHTATWIHRLTCELAGTNTGVVNTPIYLTVYRPDSPDLTLIDLPGITRNPVGDQPADIYQQVRNMILTYIEPANSIILNVMPALVDFSTCECLTLSKLVDPQLARTVAVITKLDLAERGIRHKLESGCSTMGIRIRMFGVRCRTQHESDVGVTWEQSREYESTFFRQHPELGSLYHETLQSVGYAADPHRASVSGTDEDGSSAGTGAGAGTSAGAGAGAVGLDTGAARLSLSAGSPSSSPPPSSATLLPSSSSSACQLGVPALASFLALLQAKKLREALPKLRNDVRQLLSAHKAQLATFPPACSTPNECRMRFDSQLASLFSLVDELSRGQHALAKGDVRLHIMPRISELFDAYKRDLRDAVSPFLTRTFAMQVQEEIRENAGVTLPNFTSDQVFRGLVRQQLRKMRGPTLTLAESTRALLQGIMLELCGTAFAAFPALCERVTQSIIAFFDAQHEMVLARVEEMLMCEEEVWTQNDMYLSTASKLREEVYRLVYQSGSGGSGVVGASGAGAAQQASQQQQQYQQQQQSSSSSVAPLHQRALSSMMSAVNPASYTSSASTSHGAATASASAASSSKSVTVLVNDLAVTVQPANLTVALPTPLVTNSQFPINPILDLQITCFAYCEVAQRRLCDQVPMLMRLSFVRSLPSSASALFSVALPSLYLRLQNEYHELGDKAMIELMREERETAIRRERLTSSVQRLEKALQVFDRLR